MIKRTDCWHRFARSMRLSFLFVATCLILVGCSGEELIGSVGSKHSIEILVLLDQAGVNARREKLSSEASGSYRIVVDSDDFRKARNIIYELDLPRDETRGLDEYTRHQGIFPMSQETASLRFDVAQALKVERQIEGFSGVIRARVAITTPRLGLTLSEGSRPSPQASIVVRYHAQEGNTPFPVSKVRKIVSDAVPGLSVDEVVVETVPVSLRAFQLFGSRHSGATTLWPLRFRVNPEDLGTARRQVLVVFLCAILLGGGIGVGIPYASIYLRHRFSRNPSVDKQPAVEHAVPSGHRPIRQPTLSISPKDRRKFGLTEKNR